MKKTWLKKLILSANKQGVLKAITILLLFTTFNAFAFDRTFTVIVRDGKKLSKEERLLTGFVSQTQFEGKQFKLVKATTENAIQFADPDSETVLRAATVYYHLTLAHEYFLSAQLGNESNLYSTEPLVVRIDQEKGFSEVFHFDPRAERNEYNGSRAIPASDPFMLEKNTQAWGNELWFRKAKTIQRNSPLRQVSRQLNSRDFKNMLMGQMLYTDMVSASQNAAFGTFDPEQHLASMIFSIGLAEVVPQALGIAGKFAKQRYFLDTALIPEIAIHEYAHIALAPVFGFKRSTALNEGYANYFAYKVTGLTKLGKRAGKYNRSDAPKTALSKAKYNFDQELAKQAAYGSFTFSLLFDLEQALDEEGEKILIRALNYLDAESDLKGSLTEAVRSAILDVSTRPKSQWLKAKAVFLSRGL